MLAHGVRDASARFVGRSARAGADRSVRNLTGTLYRLNPALDEVAARGRGLATLLPERELPGTGGMAAIAATPLRRVLELITVRDDLNLYRVARLLLTRAMTEDGQADGVLRLGCTLARQFHQRICLCGRCR